MPGQVWCWGFFTIGRIDKVMSFWEEDSLPIRLQAVPLAVGLENEPWSGLFAGGDISIEARTGLLLCII